MNMRELIARARIPERQVRYLIAGGFMPPPRGGRTYAEYSEEHVTAIKRYTRLRDLGFPPAAIKLLLEAKEGTPIPVVPGITLVVAPDIIGSGKKVGPLVKRIEDLLTELLRDPAK
jgi:DNA-binding transcriptional MerR regulator